MKPRSASWHSCSAAPAVAGSVSPSRVGPEAQHAPVVLVRPGRELVAGTDDRRARACEEAGDGELALLPVRARPGTADRPRDARDHRRRAQVDEHVELVAEDDGVGGAQPVGRGHRDRDV